MKRIRIVIAGAAGRDFHNFNLVYRDRDEYEVVAFTATQIPNIDGRVYPAALSGELYPNGIPIVAEDELEAVIAQNEADEVVFSYSDVTHEHVMHLGSRALAAGASYRLLSPRETMLTSSKPVVAVCAVRTGAGKSQTTRYVAELLRGAGKRVAVLRHPMPYGDLEKQAVQRFASYADLEAADCTIEKRGVRAAPARRESRLRRDRLRGDPGGGRARSRRDPLGRRQQRHALHQAGPAYRRARPAPPGTRAPLPPRRDEPTDGGRLHRQQDRFGAGGGRGGGARLDP